jgi:hypothetical protein
MPYIITTTSEQHIGYSLTPKVTRRAVATLDKAHAAAAYELRQCDTDSFAIAARVAEAYALPESGGTVGPLPDGTVIEVEPVLIENLIFRAGIKAWYVTAARRADTAMSDADVIDAYNAAQG